MLIFGYRVQALRSVLTGLCFVAFTTSCSFLKLDKEKNCLNDKAACFKADFTAPRLKQVIYPQEGAFVSVIDYVELMFTEELNNPKPSDFNFNGAANITVNSVQKINDYTYRLSLTQNLLDSGSIYLDFPNLRDYNDNKIAGQTTVSYTGNVGIPITLESVNHTGLSSTSAFDTLTVVWHYKYEAPALPASSTVFSVKVSTGTPDCNLATPINWSNKLGPTATTSPAAGAPLTSEQQYTFYLDTGLVTGSGAKTVLLCVDNAVQNKHGVTSISVWRSDTAPTTTLTPNQGLFANAKPLTFSCDDPTGRIIYQLASTTDGVTTPVVATDPAFIAASGAINIGTLYDPNNKPLTPYSPNNPTWTVYKYRCMDNAGNIESVKTSGIFKVDSNYPSVTVANIYKSGTTASVTGTSSFATSYQNIDGIWSTNLVDQNWEIRSDGAACGSGGTRVAFGTSGISGTPSPANTPFPKTIAFNAGTMTAVGDYTLTFCVYSSTTSQWGQDTFSLVRDDSAPTIGVNVPAGSYGAAPNIIFTCTDHADKIAYDQTKAPLGSAPGTPNTPVFTAGGGISVGLPFSGPITLDTQTVTSFKWKCIDRGGNESGTNTATYTVDTILPAVTVVNVQRTAVSNLAAAYPTTQITWTSSRAGLTYEVRNSGNCSGGVGGGGVAGSLGSATRYTGTTPAVGTNITNTLNIAAGDFPSIGATYSYKICVFNAINNAGYQTTVLDIMRDETVPVFPGPTTITTVDPLNFTITPTAATDANLAGYYVYRRLGANSYSTTPDYTVVAIPFTLAMPDTQTYFLKLVAFDIAGNTATIGSGEITTKPTITLTVSGLAGGTFNITDGAATLTVAGNSSAPWITTLGTGSTYNFAISSQPPTQICAIRQKQFGLLVANITINVECNTGQFVAGRFQLAKAYPSNYLYYRTRTSSLASGQTNPTSLVAVGGLLYYGNYADCDGGTLGNQYCVFKVPTTSGSVATFATGLTSPVRGVATDGTNLYFSTIAPDNKIYKAPLAGGSPVVLASSSLNNPHALTTDGSYLYIADNGSSSIQRLDLSTGIMTTVASGLTYGPLGIEIVGTDLYFTGWNSHAIYRVPKTGGSPTVVYGNEILSGFIDGNNTAIRFNQPHDLAYDGVDNIFVADYLNHRVRKIKISTGRAVVMAGDGTSGSFSQGNGPSAKIPYPVGIASDGKNIFLGNHNTGTSVMRLGDTNLVGYWPMNGVPSDFSSDGFNGSFNMTVTGSPTTVTGRFGETNGAYRFDGSTTWLSTPTQTQFNLSSEYTLSAWVYPSAVANMRIINKVTAGGCDGFNMDLVNSNKLRIQYCISGGGFLQSNTPIPINRWTHVLVQFSGIRNQARVFINGHLDAEASTAIGITSTNSLPLRIGVDSAGNNVFNGAMAEVRMYARWLNEGEINALAQDATAGVIGPGFNTGPTELVSYFDFKSGGYADTGPAALTISSGSGTVAAGKDGDTSGAYRFSGSQYLTTANSSGLPAGGHPRSLCAWVKPELGTFGWYTGSAAYGTTGNGAAYSIAHSLGNGNMMLWGDNADVGASRAATINTWTHACVTYDGAAVRIFIDGQQLGSSALILNTAAGALRIGCWVNNTNCITGTVDDVRIYNYALPANEVRQIAVQIPAGLMARYDFSGDTNDVSGQGINLTNTGATTNPDRFGVSNSAYHFDGIGNQMTNTSTTLPFPTGNQDRTMCFWGRADQMISGVRIGVAYGNSVLDQASQIGFNNLATTTPSTFGCAFGAPCSPTGYIHQNTWHHVCMVVTSINAQMYLNGSILDTNGPAAGTTVSASTWNTQPGPIEVGSFSGNYRFPGDLDDIRIYNRALSQVEIQTLVQQPNKRIYVTARAYYGTLIGNGGVSGAPTGVTGIAGADAKCNWASDANKPATGTYKAMLGGGITNLRLPCSSAYCATNGIAEGIDWVLRPNITYIRDTNLPIFTANSSGIFDFGTAANNPSAATTFANAIGATVASPWTGVNRYWNNDTACGSWDDVGTFDGKAVFGYATGTDQGNAGTNGVIYQNWTQTSVGMQVSCTAYALPLYCVEQ